MAFQGLDRFNAEFRRRMKDRTEAEVVTIHRALHMTILREAVLSTPVDTGHAVRNWLTSTGGPGGDVEGSPGGAEITDKDAFKAQQAEQLAERAVGVLSGLEPYSLSYVFNNVNYITYLNDGTDKIPAAAMAEKAIQAAKDHLDTLV